VGLLPNEKNCINNSYGIPFTTFMFAGEIIFVFTTEFSSVTFLSFFLRICKWSIYDPEKNWVIVVGDFMGDMI
jgi:hypothetical protein